MQETAIAENIFVETNVESNTEIPKLANRKWHEVIGLRQKEKLMHFSCLLPFWVGRSRRLRQMQLTAFTIAILMPKWSAPVGDQSHRGEFRRLMH